MKTINYRIQTQDGPKMVTASLTEKCANIEQISIKGTRWYDTHSNCYHKAYVSALIGGTWEELGHFAFERPGYGEGYLVTGGEWLIQNGYLTAESGAAIGGWQVREALNITHYVQDVKRKKDM